MVSLADSRQCESLHLQSCSLLQKCYDFLLNSLAKAGSSPAPFLLSSLSLLLTPSRFCNLGIFVVLLLWGSTNVLVKIIELSPPASLPELDGPADGGSLHR